MPDPTTGQVRIATAPVNYGIYGYPRRDDPVTYDPDALLASMRRAGHEATELGPPGYFGSAAAIHTLFDQHSLDVAGAYAAIRFAEPQHIPTDLEAALRTIDELAVFSADEPRLILADGGSELRRAHPARMPGEDHLALDDEGWTRLKDVTRELIDRAETVGVKAAFHPHLSTHVETPDEVEKLLAETDLALVFDTGHLLLGGTDLIDGLRKWRSRVDHVHSKDVRTDVLTKARRTERRHIDEWWHRACVPLGGGNANLEGFFSDLIGSGYQGWIVIEQDRPPGRVSDYGAIVEVESQNLAWLQDQLRKPTS